MEEGKLTYFLSSLYSLESLGVWPDISALTGSSDVASLYAGTACVVGSVGGVARFFPGKISKGVLRHYRTI